MPSSASSAFVCTRECKLHVAPGSPSRPATSSSRRLSLVPFVLVAKTSAQFFPHSRANNFDSCEFREKQILDSQNTQGGCAALAGAQQNCARAHISAERQLRIRRTTSKKLRTHSRRLNSSSGFDSENTYSALSGLAPHSGRSSVPFRLTCSGTEDISFQLLEPRLLLSRSPIRHNKLP